MATESEIMGQALDAVERMMRLFWIERILYLLGALAAMGLFVYAGYRLFSQGAVLKDDIVAVFGASGLAMVSSGGTAYFLNKCFGLVESIVRKRIAEMPATDGGTTG